MLSAAVFCLAAAPTAVLAQVWQALGAAQVVSIVGGETAVRQLKVPNGATTLRVRGDGHAFLECEFFDDTGRRLNAAPAAANPSASCTTDLRDHPTSFVSLRVHTVVMGSMPISSDVTLQFGMAPDEISGQERRGTTGAANPDSPAGPLHHRRSRAHALSRSAVMLDSSVALPRPATPSQPAVAPLLDSSNVRLEAPRLLTVDQAANVLLRIARRAALPAAPAAAQEVTHDTTMLVGDAARACLVIPPGWKFADGTPDCRTQSIVPGADNAWPWTVVPSAEADSVPISATVTALLPGQPPREFYSGHLTVHVGVAPCPLYRASCLSKSLATWQGIVASLGAIAAAGAGFLAWVRKQRTGRDPEAAQG